MWRPATRKPGWPGWPLPATTPTHHGAHVALTVAYLHGEVGDIGGAHHAVHAEDAAPGVVVQAGCLGVGAEGILLHHPQVGAAVVEQHLGVVHHAAVDAGHGEGDADEQAESDAGEDELAPGMQDVAPGEADHERTPGRRSTGSMR